MKSERSHTWECVRLAPVGGAALAPRRRVCGSAIGLLAVVLTLLAVPLPAAAEHSLTTLELRHVTAEDLLPVLRPLLAPGEAVSGSRDTLFLRTGPATTDSLRAIVLEMDRPPAWLLVTVASGDGIRSADADGSGTSRTTAGSPKAQSLRTTERREGQQVKVIEGETALVRYSLAEPYPTIATGVPLYAAPTVFGLDYRELYSIISVTPRLVGSGLQLEVGTRTEQPSREGAGKTEGTAVRTVIRAELGQWTRLSGAEPWPDEAGDAIVRSTGRSRSEREREVWVRVDRLD